jgi:hypothetical protein
MATMSRTANADGGEGADLIKEDNFSTKEAKIETQNISMWRKGFVGAEETWHQ